MADLMGVCEACGDGGTVGELCSHCNEAYYSIPFTGPPLVPPPAPPASEPEVSQRMQSLMRGMKTERERLQESLTQGEAYRLEQERQLRLYWRFLGDLKRKLSAHEPPSSYYEFRIRPSVTNIAPPPKSLWKPKPWIPEWRLDPPPRSSDTVITVRQGIEGKTLSGESSQWGQPPAYIYATARKGWFLAWISSFHGHDAFQEEFTDHVWLDVEQPLTRACYALSDVTGRSFHVVDPGGFHDNWGAGNFKRVMPFAAKALVNRGLTWE